MAVMKAVVMARIQATKTIHQAHMMVKHGLAHAHGHRTSGGANDRGGDEDGGGGVDGGGGDGDVVENAIAGGDGGGG